MITPMKAPHDHAGAAGRAGHRRRVLRRRVVQQLFRQDRPGVATFFGVEYEDTYAEGGEGEDHATEAEDSHGADHHYVFTSPPGEGAIHAAPDNDILKRGALRAPLGQVQPLRGDDPGLRDRLVVLHPQPVHPGPPRAEPEAALQLPAEQVVFRRGLRLPHRASRAVAGTFPVEGRRRVGDRWRDQRACHGDHPLLHPHAQPGAVRATSFTTPSRWSSGSWS